MVQSGAFAHQFAGTSLAEPLGYGLASFDFIFHKGENAFSWSLWTTHDKKPARDSGFSHRPNSDKITASGQAFGLRIIVSILPSIEGGFSMIARSATASIIFSISFRPISGCVISRALN